MSSNDNNKFLKFLGFWALVKIITDKPKEISSNIIKQKTELSTESSLFILLLLSILILFNSSGWLFYVSLIFSTIFFIGSIRLVLKIFLVLGVLFLILFLISLVL